MQIKHAGKAGLQQRWGETIHLQKTIEHVSLAFYIFFISLTAHAVE